nr:hypothetical protein Iba_chr06cCG1760 [Ipomoea batatas]
MLGLSPCYQGLLTPGRFPQEQGTLSCTMSSSGLSAKNFHESTMNCLQEQFCRVQGVHLQGLPDRSILRKKDLSWNSCGHLGQQKISLPLVYRTTVHSSENQSSCSVYPMCWFLR